jgi:hypothetical protein
VTQLPRTTSVRLLKAIETVDRTSEPVADEVAIVEIAECHLRAPQQSAAPSAGKVDARSVTVELHKMQRAESIGRWYRSERRLGRAALQLPKRHRDRPEQRQTIVERVGTRPRRTDGVSYLGIDTVVQ